MRNCIINYLFQFRYAKPLDKLLIIIGLLCSAATGVCQPLNTLVFGTLTGDIIIHASIMQNLTSTDPLYIREGELLIEAVSRYALYNSLIGIGMIVFSYFSIILFNYSALRQVSILNY